MITRRPEFHLTAVYEDGTTSEPQVIPVTRMPWTTAMDRRSALGMGLGLAAVFAGITALARKAQADECVVGGYAHINPVYSVAISPDGHTLVSASQDKTIKLWSLPDGALLQTLTGHTAWIDAVAISPDGRTLASGSYDKTIKLWSLPDGALLNTLTGHTSGVGAVAISPDGRTLVSASADLTIRLWSLPDGALLKTLATEVGSSAVAISPDGHTLASGHTDDFGTRKDWIKLWSFPEGALLKTLTGHADHVKAVAISPDGLMLASGSWDKTIKLWSLPDGALLKTLTGHTNLVISVAVSPDGRTLASGSVDGTIKLWSLPDGALLKTLTTTEVEALAISSDGELLASGGTRSYRGNIQLWSLPDGNPLAICLMDVSSSTSAARAAVFTRGTNTYTVACGSPIPAGVVCTCNCVAGTYVPGGGGGGCTCDLVCTCNLISSRRWKTDIQPLTDALGKIEKLLPVSFVWAPEAPEGRNGSEIGFIAEELSNVVPESVLMDPDGKALSVDYARLTTLLVEAVKSQQNQIQELRNELQNIRDKLK